MKNSQRTSVFATVGCHAFGNKVYVFLIAPGPSSLSMISSSASFFANVPGNTVVVVVDANSQWRIFSKSVINSPSNGVCCCCDTSACSCVTDCSKRPSKTWDYR